MRRNILHWLDDLKGPIEHILILTHNVDLLYVENVLLPRLRHLGEPALTIVADAGCAAMTFGNQYGLTSSLGRRYRVIGVALGSQRRFHPKAIFVLKKDEVRIAIGSGNLTAGGYGANCEAWMTWDTPEEERPVIAGFLGLVRQLPALVPMAERLGSLLKTIESSAYLRDLPTPAGLLNSLTRPILEQIVSLAERPIDELIVISPYFDRKLSALRRLSEGLASKSTILIQPRRSDLSEQQRQFLPLDTTLSTFKPASDGDQNRFIHAKIYALRTADTYHLFLGSANCSMAALVLSPSQANVELMVHATFSETQWFAFVADFAISTDPPELRMTPPDDDPGEFVGALRIAAAKVDGDQLSVDLLNGEAFETFMLNAMGSRCEAAAYEEGSFTRIKFEVDDPPRSIFIRGIRADGTFADTAASWVDDEISLGLNAPGRKLQRKFGELSKSLMWSAADYAEILEIFGDHLVWETTHRASKTAVGADAKGGGEYSLDDIFSKGFADAAGTLGQTHEPILTNENVLTAILAMLGIEIEVVGESSSGEALGSIEDLTEEELRKRELPPPPKPPEPQSDSRAKERLRRRMQRALRLIEKTMLAAGYVERRTVSRLIRDLGTLGLLLRKALADNALDESEFASTTGRVWESFFGSYGQGNGAISSQWIASDAAARKTLEEDLLDPRAAAALTIWFYPNWTKDPAERSWLNLSASLLCGSIPQIFFGQNATSTLEEIDRIRTRLLRGVPMASVTEVWTDWLRTGVALKQMSELFGGTLPAELASDRSSRKVEAGELVWHQGLCITMEAAKLSRADKCQIRPLSSSKSKVILGDFLYPVSDLIAYDAPGLDLALEKFRSPVAKLLLEVSR